MAVVHWPKTLGNSTKFIFRLFVVAVACHRRFKFHTQVMVVGFASVWLESYYIRARRAHGPGHFTCLKWFTIAIINLLLLRFLLCHVRIFSHLLLLRVCFSCLVVRVRFSVVSHHIHDALGAALYLAVDIFTSTNTHSGAHLFLLFSPFISGTSQSPPNPTGKANPLPKQQSWYLNSSIPDVADTKMPKRNSWNGNDLWILHLQQWRRLTVKTDAWVNCMNKIMWRMDGMLDAGCTMLFHLNLNAKKCRNGFTAIHIYSEMLSFDSIVSRAFCIRRWLPTKMPH